MRRFDPQQSGAPRFSVEARCLDSTSSSCSHSSCRSTRLPCIDRFHDHRESRFHRSHNSNPFLSFPPPLSFFLRAYLSLSLSLLFLSLFSFFFFFSTRLMPLPLPPPFLSLPSLLFLVSLASSLPPPPLRNFFTSRNEKKSEGENLGLEVERDIPAGRWLDFESSSRTETTGSGSNGPRWWTTSTDAGLPRCSIDSGA